MAGDARKAAAGTKNLPMPAAGRGYGYEYEPGLTPEQEAEFGTPMLRAFLKSYLRFRHSSPYTTKRKIFRYFEPAPAGQLSEKDLLYGADREETYKALMADFRACVVAREFDGLFNGRTYHWQSETVPGLVLLRKWIDAPAP